MFESFISFFIKYTIFFLFSRYERVFLHKFFLNEEHAKFHPEIYPQCKAATSNPNLQETGVDKTKISGKSSSRILSTRKGRKKKAKEHSSASLSPLSKDKTMARPRERNRNPWRVRAMLLFCTLLLGSPATASPINSKREFLAISLCSRCRCRCGLYVYVQLRPGRLRQGFPAPRSRHHGGVRVHELVARPVRRHPGHTARALQLRVDPRAGVAYGSRRPRRHC